MNVELAVERQRARAEVLLAAILELRALRGRLTRVTVDDMALVLAMLDAGDYAAAPSAPSSGDLDALRADVVRLYLDPCFCDDVGQNPLCEACTRIKGVLSLIDAARLASQPDRATDG